MLKNYIKLSLLISLLSTSLLALENMRPQMELKAIPDGVEITLDFSEIQTWQWSDLLGRPNQFPEAGFGLASKPGDPALPSMTELIPIISAGSPESIIRATSGRSLISAELIKTPPGRSENDAPVPIQKYKWSRKTQERLASVQLGTPVTMQNKTFLPVTIQPLGLDMNQRKVSIPEKIVIQISGITPGDVSAPGVADRIRSIIPEDEIYEQLGHYLIVTPPLFEPYLEQLVEWKARKGHPVTVVTTTEAGQTTTTLKNYIQDAYDTWENPPEYVLLIGDVDRGIGGFYVYNPENEALVTDQPYVHLDGDDSFPDAWIGRLSVDTIGELGVVISKILHYERDPYMEETGWYKRGLMVGTITQAISVQQTNNWVSRKLMENGFTQVDTAYYPMQSSLSNITTPINAGVSWVNYRGLGAWDHWIGPYFYNDHIDDLSNGFKLPVMTSIVCGGGNFAAPVDPVFGEKWLRAGTPTVPKGAVAFIGPSELHTHTQFNNVIDMGLYSALFDLEMNELGPALWHAKYQLWRNYHQSEFLPFGQSAEFYHQVYNILGDPGMAVWTDIPQSLVVDYPETLNGSDNHITINVQDQDGLAVSGAFVYILNESNALGGKTDASGSVTLAFSPGADTTLALTITGRNLHPVLETVDITADVNEVNYSDWEFSPSGLLEAGGIHGLNLTLENNAGLISELTLSLSTTNENCSITDAEYVLANFGAGASITLEDIFEIEVDTSTGHGDIADFVLNVDTGSETWTWQRSFPIQAPELEITELIVMGAEPVPGERVTLRLNVANTGGLDAPALDVTFLGHPMVEPTSPNLNCPPIAIDGSALSSSLLFLRLSDQIFPGEEVSLGFALEYPGRSDTLFCAFTAGVLNRFAPSHPDAYGYRVYDDMDVSFALAPEYDWLEIDPELDGLGIRLDLNDPEEEDDESVLIDLPFSVTYYGQSYDAMTVCTNGWLALGSTPELSFYNQVIPSEAGPNAMIAAYWDDLTTDPGAVCYYETEDQFIVEWSQMSHLDVNTSLSFQIIIYDTDSFPTPTGDNQIKIQFKNYGDYDTWANFSTTGIEAPDYSTGLQTSFNNIADISVGALHSEQALLYTTERSESFPAPEMRLSPSSLDFVLNPWSQASDSIAIINNGGSLLVYNVEPLDEADRQVAANPLAGYNFTKDGPEPDGGDYISNTRDLMDYTWLDQDDEGGPEFWWYDIAQPENSIPFTGDPDDSSIGPFPIGFDFPFFRDNYSEFYFSSNGTMSFVSDAFPWANLTLPNGGAPPALIAPWWDDLNNDEGPQGEPYFWSNGVDTAVVCWNEFRKWGTDNIHTFQVVLVANGDILMQYQELEGYRGSSTVGIQNQQKNRGLQIVYNTANNINDGTAIRIQRNLSWFSANSWYGQVEPGETGYFAVNVDTRHLDAGTISLPLQVTSNALNLPEAQVTIDLEVVLGAPPVGDVNFDYQVNIHDMLALIEYALEIDVPDTGEFDRANLNEDDRLNVLDAVLLSEAALNR